MHRPNGRVGAEQHDDEREPCASISDSTVQRSLPGGNQRRQRDQAVKAAPWMWSRAVILGVPTGVSNQGAR